ncbi:MAG: efflux RND transporter periplasmic adaptor subunit, partial [Kiloniellales bacterium]|nr:efflux RND transporter periplasmic adaptor subunit [Kiloniellales bacterium]
EVAAKIDGPVEEFLVEVGDRLEKGDIIAILNDATLAARMELAQTAVSVSRAQLETSREEMVLSKQELTRIEKLRNSAAFSQARYDDIRQGVNIALRRVHQSEALVARAQAELELSGINLAYTRIAAPYDGVVTRKLTEEGAYVQTGDPVVFMVADKSLEIEAPVPFDRLGGLVEGTSVEVHLDDGTEHTARVRAVLPSENPLTRTRIVRFEPDFNGIRERLANAQSVTVMVPAGPSRSVLTVHKDAIIQSPGGMLVYVVEDDMAVARQIEIGEGLGVRIEVVHGLSEGDLAIVRGNERLRPDTSVRIDGAS